jgi:hypothetical protein
MAHMRQTNSANVGPVLGPYRTFVRPPATSQFDPEQKLGPIDSPIGRAYSSSHRFL